MKKLIFICWMAILATGSQAQNKVTFSSDDAPAVEAEILKLEHMLVDLLQKGDYDSYSGYLTEDYTRMTAAGEISNKEQTMQAFRSGGAKSVTKPRDMDVRVFGDMAILNGVMDMEAKDGVAKTSNYITKVFVKRNGQWYLALLQGTKMK